MLWANTIDSVNDIWPSIQVTFEQTELVKVAFEAIQKVKEELGNKPEDEIDSSTCSTTRIAMNSNR